MLGWVQWANDGCFQLEEEWKKETCEDMYDLTQHNGPVENNQNVMDLLKVTCMEAEIRYIYKAMFILSKGKIINNPPHRNGGTFDSCAVRSRNGICLATRRFRQIDMKNKCSILSKLFNTECTT